MNAYQLLGDQIRYNQWANNKVINWLKEQSSELFLVPITGSFANLNKLLHHMMEAESYYLSLLTSEQVPYFEDLATEQVFTRLSEVDQQLLSWFNLQDEEVVSRVISLKRSAYEERYHVATLITHVVNHGTYHRGQLVHTRHQLGISAPPKTDFYWKYAEAMMK